MTDPQTRRETRNRTLPGPWQRLEHGLRFRMGEINGTTMALVDDRQWVPIGPSIVQEDLSDRDGHMLVSGRVRDIEISDDGTRAYAGAAKGGVWYTEDSGRSWRPVGGWVRRIGTAGGPNSVLSVGCLLVKFGNSAAEDFVMVGTGELRPTGSRDDEAMKLGGVGVLSALGPATRPLDEDPWEQANGLAAMEGLGTFRLARKPGVTAGADGDVVMAATSKGLFRGTRSGGRFTWTLRTPTYHDDQGTAHVFQDAENNPAEPSFTDIVWVENPADPDGRLFATLVEPHTDSLDFAGPPSPAFSDDEGGRFDQVDGSMLGMMAARMQRPKGRASLATVGTGSGVRVYVLGGWNDNNSKRKPEVCALDHPLEPRSGGANRPTLRRLRPHRSVRRFWDQTDSGLWGKQAGYNQAIAAVQVGTGASAKDRLFLGGAAITSRANDWVGSLWCFEVDGNDLKQVDGISSVARPIRARRRGHVGDGTHADVHSIKVAKDQTDVVWVGNDGGVTVSTQGGRDGTFITRSTGLAALESGFVASHPNSTQFATIGCQDNGVQVRTGDTFWEVTLSGDGGGVAFDPVRPHNLHGQAHDGLWNGAPSRWFQRPAIWARRNRPDFDNAEFYANTAVARLEPSSSTTRVAIGTDRVWVNDQRGTARRANWRVLPGFHFRSGSGGFNRTGTVRRSKRLGDLPRRGRSQVTFGILRINEASGNTNARDGVAALRWVLDSQQKATKLLALIGETVYRYEQVGPATSHRWRPVLVSMIGLDMPSTPSGSFTTSYIVTDIAPVHGTDMFYITTTGDAAGSFVDTAYFWDGTQLLRTGLRDKLTQVNPAYAVTVDNENQDVYVGTALGVWRGVRNPADNTFRWDLIGKRLPPTVIQDLHIHKPSATSPKTLVAALEARGAWQLNLDNEDHEQTYIRSHQFDDRRTFPTSRAHPRRDAETVPFDQSPDIVVRPRWPRTDPPPAYPGQPLTANRRSRTPYQLWTFQTAFRHHMPEVVADGKWTRQFAQAIERFRRDRSDVADSPRQAIDQALWDLVVTNNPTAVYQPSWRFNTTRTPANEADLRNVVPQRAPGGRWHVPAEQSTVEVLVHHRDTDPVAADQTFALLLWQWGDPSTVDCTGIANFAQSVNATTGAAPSGNSDWTAPTASNPNGRFRNWHVAMNGSSVLHRLSVSLDARLPRAIPIDIDLTRNIGAAQPTQVEGDIVLLAIVGSTADRFSHRLPTATDAEGFVSTWRHAAIRTIHCTGPR